ncbi:glycosyltransferase [Phenylobacterium terrae]|uniref:Glycosyltransferase n=1 Tax=Phenylobacterium terrae TaxID=2665495 RepID=A0ABW4N402_9CAUL
MKISIHTLGTRGDVQPYLALALALIRAGHQVLLAAPQQFAGLIEGQGVPFAPLPAGFLDLLDTPQGKAAIARGRGFSGGLKLLKHVRPLMRELFDAEWRAAAGFSPDLIVHHPKSLASPHMAEKLGVEALLASPLPGFTPTAAFPSPLLPFRTLGPLNRASHRLAIQGGQTLFRRAIAQWRASVLGLDGAGAGRAPVRTLYAYSPAVLPRPADWSDDVCVSGYWVLDAPWAPPADLAAFLSAGDRPVYVGFGSMPGIDPRELTETVAAALARAGRRGVLATGGGALTPIAAGPHVHFIDAAPHTALLPLMSAALHHGGAGTTGASLSAGLPTIVCPFMGDQPFWARRVHDLGAGPAPLDRRRLTADALARAFDAAAQPGMARAAGRLAGRIAQEDELATAVGFIEGAPRRSGERRQGAAPR